MSDPSNTSTHTAFALRRVTKRQSRWLEIGKARTEKNGAMHVFLDRLPIGGFTGYVCLVPIGTEPPVVEPEPQRPPSPGDADDEADDA